MAIRQSCSAKFKHEAIQMLERGDRKVGQVSRDLGVHRSLLTKWRAEAAHDQAATISAPNWPALNESLPASRRSGIS